MLVHFIVSSSVAHSVCPPVHLTLVQWVEMAKWIVPVYRTVCTNWATANYCWLHKYLVRTLSLAKQQDARCFTVYH